MNSHNSKHRRTLYLLCLVSVCAVAEISHASNKLIGEVLCQGSKTSTNLGIYLHGLDSLTPSKQELANRQKLSEIAASKTIATAIVRSAQTCKRRGKVQLCWPMNSLAVIEKIVDSLSLAAKKCAPNAKAVYWWGFSNGGYFLGKALQSCLFGEKDTVFMIGSAGRRIQWQKNNLRQCGQAKVLIGKKDRLTRAAALKYFELLRRLKANVDLIEYDGGHDFVKAPIF